jgi:cell division protein FtsA
VIGIGSNPSRGLKRGVVVNIESTVQSIQRAIEEAELMAGCEINTVRRDRGHARSLNSHGIVDPRQGGQRGDVERAIDAARAVAIPPTNACDSRGCRRVHRRFAGGHP